MHWVVHTKGKNCSSVQHHNSAYYNHVSVHSLSSHDLSCDSYSDTGYNGSLMPDGVKRKGMMTGTSHVKKFNTPTCHRDGAANVIVFFWRAIVAQWPP
eukprot:COSAG02_NODE_1_length_108762_cov_456.708287_64_plen_98_part_00